MSVRPERIRSRVAIIGRPNVGKSTLFNTLTRTRKAVVKNEPGVTRDVLVEPAEWWGHKFDVVDTGGITESDEGFSALIREQVLDILGSMDLLLVVMDGKVGLVPEDRDIIRIAKESGKPFLLVVNKVDRFQDADLVTSEFYEFGLDLIPASFEKHDGVDRLVEWVIEKLPQGEHTQRGGIRLALVGKPNAGKSSLSNQLLGERRMLVSPIAGTTVDAVEAEFTYEGESYILVDTAGLRRSSKRHDGVEFISAVKSHNAIDRAEIVLLLVDATLGPSMQDARLVEYCLERHKAVIMVANKSDIGKAEIPAFRSTFKAQVDKAFHFFPDIPVVFASAKTGSGIKDLFAKIEETYKKLYIRISTSHLNKFFFEVIRQAPAPVWGTRNVKFYYLTQTHQIPPSFIAFANHPQGVTPAYRRFLAKRVQERWDLQGIPVRIFIMKSRSGKKRRSSQEPIDVETDEPIEDFGPGSVYELDDSWDDMSEE